MQFSTIFRLIVVVCFSVLIVSDVWSQEIIPQPNSYQRSAGVFRVSATLTIGSNDRHFADLIPGFAANAMKYASLNVSEKSGNAKINLIRNLEIENPEAYRLTINEKQITIEASKEQGCFYGLQSLLQQIVFAGNEKIIPCAIIDDVPRFAWRGLMLDESRHFFGPAEVRRILDLMALHKLNKFHWHLTDAPGWRIEILKYPLLTAIGAKGNYSDPQAPTKFYTQKEIKEIVEYASQRFIEIIPEIDMPGHATAAVRAYPQFSGGGSLKYPDFTFNPGDDKTYGFLTDVLTEVGSLFPSKYIHVGGDEVSFGNHQWPMLPAVIKLMKDQGLKNLQEVEHYFIRRMADSIQSIGKTLLGWDEVVAAGLEKDQTVVMWWRHDKPEVLSNAIEKGYRVVLCPRIPLYFDFVQNIKHESGRKWAGKFAPLESVYQFPSEEFVSERLFGNNQVVGIQANVWTETIHTPERLHFMVYPRLSGLAEAAWTNDRNKNLNGFLNRLSKMLVVYGKEGVGYYDFIKEENSEIKYIRIENHVD